MTGASGSFYSRVNNYNLEGYLTLTVKWKQTFTAGSDFSTVEIEAALVRDDSGNSAGGTWLASSDGGIIVNGTKVCGWYKNESAGWTHPGSTGWSGKGSVKVNHTAAKTITIEIQSVTWNNGTYSSSSFTIPRKTQNVTLQAVQQGLVYIDDGKTVAAYLVYIDNGKSWEQYMPYIDNGKGWDMCS